MKHATAETIASIEPLLTRIRELPGLKEKKAGIFYFKSSAFLHFHEDGDQVFADIKINPPVFQRYPATTADEQNDLVRLIREKLA